MTIATADYAAGKDGSSPPDELVLYWDMQAFSALPNAGGILDQPAGLLRKIRHVARVHWAVREHSANALKAGKGAQWKSDHPDVMAIINYVESIRKHGTEQT